MSNHSRIIPIWIEVFRDGNSGFDFAAARDLKEITPDEDTMAILHREIQFVEGDRDDLGPGVSG